MSPRTLARHTTAIANRLATGHQRGSTRDTDARPDDSCWAFS